MGQMSVLGRLGIEQEDWVASRGLPGRRSELVFAYLAVEHRRMVSRDELAEALWPDVLPDTWAAALRSVVTEVRRFLEDAGWNPPEVLASGRGGYQLRLPRGVRLDLDEAREALAAGGERFAGDQPAGGDGFACDQPAVAAEHAKRAAALARLPFLPHHEGEWVSGVRDELESLHVEALELQVRAHTQAGDPRAAADAAERLVRAEPFREAVHQLRIRVLGESGDRAGAVA